MPVPLHECLIPTKKEQRHSGGSYLSTTGWLVLITLAVLLLLLLSLVPRDACGAGQDPATAPAVIASCRKHSLEIHVGARLAGIRPSLLTSLMAAESGCRAAALSPHKLDHGPAQMRLYFWRDWLANMGLPGEALRQPLVAFILPGAGMAYLRRTYRIQTDEQLLCVWAKGPNKGLPDKDGCRYSKRILQLERTVYRRQPLVPANERVLAFLGVRRSGSSTSCQ